MMPAINLIPADYLHARRHRRRLRRWSVICGVYGLVLLAITVVLQTAWSFDDQAVADQLNRTTQAMHTAEKSMADLRTQLAEAMKQLEAGRAVSVQPDWSVLLALLAETRRQAIVLKSVGVTPIEIKGKIAPAIASAKPPVVAGSKSPATAAFGAAQRPNYRMEISGMSQGQNDVSQFALRLEQTGLFKRVTLLESIRQPIGASQVVGFRIEAELTEEPERSH